MKYGTFKYGENKYGGIPKTLNFNVKISGNITKSIIKKLIFSSICNTSINMFKNIIKKLVSVIGINIHKSNQINKIIVNPIRINSKIQRMISKSMITINQIKNLVIKITNKKLSAFTKVTNSFLYLVYNPVRGIISLLASVESPINLFEGDENMATTNQNFTMYSGDTKILNFACTMENTLSGATIKWALGRGSKKIITKTTPYDIVITGDKTFTVYINPIDTTAISGQYLHEAEITDALGNVSTVATGKVIILRDIA